MSAYYNEIDPYAAAWLRRLIAAGHIADGIVDERSIEDIHPAELREFTQCHFFAGIGVWSRALRLARWPDERRVWTGSCPCQPFSAAGKGAGFADERHLWPAFHHLIAECRPPVVFGEQVASKDGLQWLDLVRADLEGSGYAIGAADLCAAGVGAPHIRQRLWWVGVADAEVEQRRRLREGERLVGEETAQGKPRHQSAFSACDSGTTDRLADTSETGRSRQREDNDCCPEVAEGRQAGSGAHIAGRSTSCGLDNNNNTGLEGFGRGHCAEGGWEGAVRPVAEAGESGGVADAYGNAAAQERAGDDPFGQQRSAQWGRPEQPAWAGAGSGIGRGGDSGGRAGIRASDGLAGMERPSPTHGHWGDADWLFCRDGKWRPVEPGTFPLVDGAPARVGRLRAYGNAIVCQVAQTFINAYLDIRG
jgi:DNA (cytosine-5)-methyltransferase 1